MRRSTPSVVGIAFVCTLTWGALAVCGCNGHGSARQDPRPPTAADPAFGFVGNVLVSEGADASDVTRTWVGFSAPSFHFQGIRANRQRLLSGDPLLIGGTVVPSDHHPSGFYFDPATTRTAAVLDENQQTTLAAIELDPEHPKVAPSDLFHGSWVEVRVEQIVETPAACQDGFVQLAEDCDPPGTQCRGAFEINTKPRVCNPDCTCPSPCGNGVVDASNEQCDDGNTISGDGCSACLVDPVSVARDFATGFQRFVFFRTFGLGFCFEVGSLQRVSIERDASTGELRLEAATFGATDCDFWIDTDCPPTVALPGRTLTDAETSRVLAAFAAVEITGTDGLYCGSDDRCLFHRFVWTNLDADGIEIVFGIDENDCAPRLLQPELRRLLNVIDEVALP